MNIWERARKGIPPEAPAYEYAELHPNDLKDRRRAAQDLEMHQRNALDDRAKVPKLRTERNPEAHRNKYRSRP